MDLSNKTYLVTGGSRGIGLAVAQRLHQRGASLWLASRGDSAASAPSGPEGSHSLAFDLGTDAGVFGLASAVAEVSLDGIVHCAGACVLGRIEDVEAEDLDLQWRVNLRAPFLLSKALLPQLRSTRGTIVFINSGAGKIAKPNWGAYAVTKHGLKALADSLRAEVSPDGIRVSTVYPGRTATEMQAGVRNWEGKAYEPSSFVQPEQVAEAVLLALETQAPAVVDEISIRPLS